MGGLAHRKKRLIERDAKQRNAYVMNISNGGGIKKTQQSNHKTSKSNSSSSSRQGNLAQLITACAENRTDLVVGNHNELNVTAGERHEERRVGKFSSGISISALLNP